MASPSQYNWLHKPQLGPEMHWAELNQNSYSQYMMTDLIEIHRECNSLSSILPNCFTEQKWWTQGKLFFVVHFYLWACYRCPAFLWMKMDRAVAWPTFCSYILFYTIQRYSGRTGWPETKSIGFKELHLHAELRSWQMAQNIFSSSPPSSYSNPLCSPKAVPQDLGICWWYVE